MFKHRAFSLIELLMVLGLMALLASISVPAMRSWQNRIEIDRANSALIELISEAKRRAVHEGHSWGVRMSSPPACLLLELQDHHSPLPRRRQTDPRDTRTLPNSIQIEFLRMDSDQRLPSLTVDSLGNTTPARIWLSQNGRRVESYKIDRLTSGVQKAK